MAKVSMKIEIAGARSGGSWPVRGGILEVSEAEAAELVAQGFAEVFVESEVVESVDAVVVETAAVAEPTPEDKPKVEKAVAAPAETRAKV